MTYSKNVLVFMSYTVSHIPSMIVIAIKRSFAMKTLNLITLSLLTAGLTAPVFAQQTEVPLYLLKAIGA